MDIEQLSKSQIVLLTLLVSFVTSIATGIVTVSLMDQAPPAIAQTVNRIVERTIEKVVPQGQTASSVITQEKTVVVKESDLISQMVGRVNSSVVRLYTSDAESPEFLGLGVVLDDKGTIATGAAIGDSVSILAELDNRSRVRAFISSKDDAYGIARFDSATSTTDGKAVVWKAVSIAAKDPMLGETVVALSGKTVPRIATGLVTTLIPGANDKAPQSIDTNVAPESILPGSPIFNTDGGLIGFSTAISKAASPSGFLSSSILIKALETKVLP